MSIEQEIQKSTCRIDKNGEQQGSAFWINDDKLVTAAHVVDNFAETGVNIRAPDGESISCAVTHNDPITSSNQGTDLALLEPAREPGDYGMLSIDANVPPIGTEVVWSGYATLFGEPRINRQRFGWGKIASEKYKKSNAEFFEVDGLFNPSHSGGPVVSKENEQVIGVVSASAGRFDKLEEKWFDRSNLLEEATDLYRKSTEEGSGVYSTFTTTDPPNAAAIQHIFDRIGVNYEANTNGTEISIRFLRSEIPGRFGAVLHEMADLLLETAHGTFQMGIGIASGGEPLADLE